MVGIVCLITTVVSAETLDKIVAVVNDNAITQSQLNEQVELYREQLQFSQAPIPAPAVLRKQALQHMIDTQLQLQLAKKENITADDAKVTQAITHIAQQNGLTLDQLKSKVAQQGMSYDKYRAEIKKQMIISDLQQREVAPRVVISEQEVTDFLQQHGKSLTAMQTPGAAATGTSNKPVQYHIIDILIPLPDAPSQQQQADALQKAKTILTKLRSGATVDVQTDDLGWRTLQDIPDIFAPIVKNMQPGTVSEAIRAPNGYHIIQLAGVRGGATATNSMPASMPTYATHARHILIKTNPLTTDQDAKDRLVRIRDAIEHGTDFAQLAKEDSQDPGSASKGGDLGWVNPGMLDPTFEKVMNGLKAGAISEPFKTAFGWHIVQVLERKSVAKDQSFLRTQARAILYQRKYGETLQNWLQQLRSQSYVKMMDN
jgi:peptidyl-prolyl cis-trans isomerase SurA